MSGGREGLQVGKEVILALNYCRVEGPGKETHHDPEIRTRV